MISDDYIYEMKDENLEQGIVGFLQGEKYTIVELYGELILEWLENPTNGPLLLYAFENLIIDNFEQAIFETFGAIDITMYVLHIDTEDESSHFMIWLFHGSYYKISLFGEVMSHQQYEKALTQALEGEDNETGT